MWKNLLLMLAGIGFLQLHGADLGALLDAAKDGDTLELSGRYTVDRQIIVDRRVSLKGRDFNTTIVVDASKDPNAGIWYSHPTTGWSTPRMPVIVENISFEAAPESLFQGVGVAFVVNFHGAVVSRCRFDNLGQRGILVWGGLFVELSHNFFSRSGIFMPGCEGEDPFPEWNIDTAKMPKNMELNQVHIRGGEMQWGFPAMPGYPGDYMVDIRLAGAIIIENFCVEGVEDQGALSIRNSRNILIENLWLEGVGSRVDLGIGRDFKGLVHLENCTAVKVTGGHLANSSFTGAGYVYGTKPDTHLYYSLVPLFNLENVCGITFANGNTSAELVTPGFLRTDATCAGIIFRENSSRHYQALSSRHNLDTRDNVVSSYAPWLMQAADELVREDLPPVPLAQLKIPPPPAADGDSYCYVLELQIRAERPESSRLVLADAEGKRLQDFPIELSATPKLIRFGLQEFDFASRAAKLVLHPEAAPNAIEVGFAGWKKIPTSLHVDPSGRKQYIGFLPR